MGTGVRRVGLLWVVAWGWVSSGARAEESAAARGWAPALASRRLGVVYVGLGGAAVRLASRSARLCRRHNPELRILLVTGRAKSSAERWSIYDEATDRHLSVFDEVVDVGDTLAIDREKHASLTAAALAVGLEHYDAVLSLDTATVVCGVDASQPASHHRSVTGLFTAVLGRGHDVGYVRDFGHLAHADPRGALVLRNTSAVARMLAYWHQSSSRRLSESHARAARSLRESYARIAFNFGLYKSKVQALVLEERTWNCVDARACSRDCVIARGADLSAQSDDAHAVNSLPNFFVKQQQQQRMSLEDFDDDDYRRAPPLFLHEKQQQRKSHEDYDDDDYRRAPSLFLHVPKAAGNSVKELFVKRFLKTFHHTHDEDLFRQDAARRNTKKGGLVRSHSLHIDTRRAWDASPPSTKGAYDLFYGAFGLGACRSHPRGPCAHYVVLRHPVARIVSEHKYCRDCDFEDQTCTGRLGAGRMRRLDVAAWAEDRGNFMLEHFMDLSPLDWVDVGPQNKPPSDAFVPWHHRDKWTRVNPIETRRIREGPATPADLDLVLSHLEDWFAIVGITERFEESMALFSFALTGKQISNEQAGSVHTHNANTSVSSLDEATLRRVEAAVALDLRLYEAACALFERQLAAFKARGLTIDHRR